MVEWHGGTGGLRGHTTASPRLYHPSFYAVLARRRALRTCERESRRRARVKGDLEEHTSNGISLRKQALST